MLAAQQVALAKALASRQPRTCALARSRARRRRLPEPGGTPGSSSRSTRRISRDQLRVSPGPRMCAGWTMMKGRPDARTDPLGLELGALVVDPALAAALRHVLAQGPVHQVRIGRHAGGVHERGHAGRARRGDQRSACRRHWCAVCAALPGRQVLVSAAVWNTASTPAMAWRSESGSVRSPRTGWAPSPASTPSVSVAARQGADPRRRPRAARGPGAGRGNRRRRSAAHRPSDSPRKGRSA